MFWQKKKSKVESSVAYLKAIDTSPDGEAISLSQDDSPVLTPFAPGMAIFYLIDQGSHYQYVNHRDLAESGLSTEQLHQQGIANLIKALNAADFRVQPYGNIFAVLCGGQFEASTLLVEQLWSQQFKGFVKGEYALAIAAKDVLAFCDSQSEQGIAELKQLIDRVYPVGSNVISDQVHILRNGKPEPMLCT